MKKSFLLFLMIAIAMGPCSRNGQKFSAYAQDSLLAKAVSSEQWVDWEKISRQTMVDSEELRMLAYIQKKVNTFQPLSDQEAFFLAELWGTSDQRIAHKTDKIIRQLIEGIDQVDIKKNIGGEDLTIILNYYTIIGGTILSLESRKDEKLFQARKELIAEQGKRVIVPLVLYGFTNMEESVRTASCDVMMMIDEDPIEIAHILYDFFTVEYNQIIDDKAMQKLLDAFVALEEKNAQDNEIYQSFMAYAQDALSGYCLLDARATYDERSLARINRLLTSLQP